MVWSRSIRTARCAAAFLACAALGAGCADTAIVLELQGRFEIPEDINAIEVSVTVLGTGAAGRVFDTGQILLEPDDDMPYLIALVPGAAPLGPVTVNVNAFHVDGSSGGFLVASGAAGSAFERDRVNRAVIVLGRAACGDDLLEDLDDGFYGAPVNVAKDGDWSDLALCPDDTVDRFNFVVPPGQELFVAIDRFVAADPAIESMQAILRCQGWEDPAPVTLASGPVSYGAFLVVDPVPTESRTCILDVERLEGAPEAKIAYGFVARLYPFVGLPFCSDDTHPEPIPLLVTAGGGEVFGPSDTMLCPQDADRFAVSAPPSRLLSVRLDTTAPPGAISGALECDPAFARGASAVFPLLGRTLPAGGGASTVPCSLDLLDLEPFSYGYTVRITEAGLQACLLDAASPNATPDTAFDLIGAGFSPISGGRLDGLVVCAGANDHFTYTYLGLASQLILTVQAPYYPDGDVNVCITPTASAIGAGPVAAGDNCGFGMTGQEVLSVPASFGTIYSITVTCAGSPCGNVYGLEIAEGT